MSMLETCDIYSGLFKLKLDFSHNIWQALYTVRQMLTIPREFLPKYRGHPSGYNILGLVGATETPRTAGEQRLYPW